MLDKIMMTLAKILMIAEAAAVVFLLCAWKRDKRRAEDGNLS